VRVFRFVVRLVRDEATAEDVISEVFLDVWRQAGRFEGRSTVSTWLLAIARFKAISAIKRRRDEELDEEAAAARICRTIPQLCWRRRIQVQCCESASQDFRRNIERTVRYR
jgi:RNA polymerase sigma factor (sigma-70 family)